MDYKYYFDPPPDPQYTLDYPRIASKSLGRALPLLAGCWDVESRERADDHNHNHTARHAPTQAIMSGAEEDLLGHCLERHRTQVPWDRQEGKYVTSNMHGGRIFVR